MTESTTCVPQGKPLTQGHDSQQLAQKDAIFQLRCQIKAQSTDLVTKSQFFLQVLDYLTLNVSLHP